MTKTFAGDLQHIAGKLEMMETFAFSRFSDGELYVMRGDNVSIDLTGCTVGDRRYNMPYPELDRKTIDQDTLDGQVFKDWLLRAFRHSQPEYYKGLCCKCCVGEENYNQQLELIEDGFDEWCTWSNLFLNSNYKTFIEEVAPLFGSYNTLVICNEAAEVDTESAYFRRLEQVFTIGTDTLTDEASRDVIFELGDYLMRSDPMDHKLILCSASSLSNLIIYEMYKSYPWNTYLDIGTTLHPALGMGYPRDYLQGYWLKQGGSFANRTCIW